MESAQIAPEIAAVLSAAEGAPSQKLPPGEWMQKNLFSDAKNSILTVIVASIALATAFFIARWVIDSDFAIVRTNLRSFMIGQFPREELWRPWASGYVLLVALGLTTGALARSSYEVALSQDLPAEKESLAGLARRFWAIIAIMVFFVSFARTFLPYIGVAVALGLVL